jgi:DNA-nicking Smr family endonuclease
MNTPFDSDKNDDHALFLKEMKGVTPLTPPNVSLSPVPKPPPTPKNASGDSHSVMADLLSTAPDDLYSSDEMTYLRAGYPNKILRNLRRGHYRFENRLDLHGCTIDQAESLTRQFIQEAILRGETTLMIVHGKGLRSNSDKPIIKNWLNHWLRRHSGVLAFCSAKPEDGGTGALYLLLAPK